MAAPAESRIVYIDFLKGLACLVILYIHAVTPRVEGLPLPDLAVFTLLFASTTMFFFASGMNVVNFLARHRDNGRFRITRFYLAAAAMLFFLSICYSVNHSSMRLPQIFQGIALATAAVFLLLRTRLPNWALIIIAGVLYFVWVLYWLRISPLVAPLRPLGFSEEMRRFLAWTAGRGPLERFLFLHFSLLPWVSVTLAGAATYRSIRQNPSTADRWWVFYALLPFAGLASILLTPVRQPLFLHSYSDMILRNYPLLFFTWMSMVGVGFLAAARWYPGGDRFHSPALARTAKYLEFLGRESFLFLIWHWLALTLLSAFFARLLANPVFATSRMAIYFPWLATTVVVLTTMTWATRLGERWRRRPRFVPEASLVLALGTLPGLLSFAARGAIGFPGMLLSFTACLAFAYLYPVLREKLHRRYTLPYPTDSVDPSPLA